MICDVRAETIKKKALVFAVVHLITVLLCLSQSSFNIIPAPADTHVAPTPVFNCMLAVLLAPVVLAWMLVMWIQITLKDVVPQVYLRYMFCIVPVAFIVSSPLYGLLAAWIHTKLKTRTTG